MERTPATNGAEYVTTARKTSGNPLLRLLPRTGRSLNIDLDRLDALARPWLGAPAEPGPAADMLVVGGGVAGLSSALAAATRGLRVVLVDASAHLGGRTRLFGTQEGEESPGEVIARLTDEVAEQDAITVLLGAEVFAVRSGIARLHHVTTVEGVVSGRVVDIRARHIVLATGALERLPVFPGNRLPGVVGALEAFELAQLFDIWPGGSTLVATSSSPAYRLAMLARDANIAVSRVVDSRAVPQSRFIEFAKAYGITLAPGTIVAAASPAARGRGLVVLPQMSINGFTRAEPEIGTDRLIACGGWQPDLTLWHMANGESIWNSTLGLLEPHGSLPDIALAGSAAGWLSRSACLSSGGEAVDMLLGRQQRPVEERLIDPVYETPDAVTPVGNPPEDNTPPAYLDGGRRYVTRPAEQVSSWPGWLPFAPRPQGWSLADTPQALDIGDIAAGVQLGAIPPASAGIVAQERVANVPINAAPGATRNDVAGPLPLPPAWLAGRYPGASLRIVVPEDEARTLDPGTLIFSDADQSDALLAIGVIVRIVDDRAVALVRGTEGQVASAREGGRSIDIRLASSLGPEHGA